MADDLAPCIHLVCQKYLRYFWVYRGSPPPPRKAECKNRLSYNHHACEVLRVFNFCRNAFPTINYERASLKEQCYNVWGTWSPPWKRAKGFHGGPKLSLVLVERFERDCLQLHCSYIPRRYWTHGNLCFIDWPSSSLSERPLLHQINAGGQQYFGINKAHLITLTIIKIAPNVEVCFRKIWASSVADFRRPR